MSNEGTEMTLADAVTLFAIECGLAPEPWQMTFLQQVYRPESKP